MLLSTWVIFSAFSIQHHFPEPDRQGERRGRGTGKKIKRHTPWITHANTHINMRIHMQEHIVWLCLISLAVYQGDQEFNAVKFPADKTVFGEVGSNECWAAQRRRRRRGKRKWRRWEKDDKRALQFNCLPDTFTSSLSSFSHLLQQLRKSPLTDGADTLLFVRKELKVYGDGLTNTETDRLLRTLFTVAQSTNCCERSRIVEM